MAEQRVQNYANHVHRPMLFAVAFFATLIALGFFVWEMVRFRGPLMYGLLALWIAVMCLCLAARLYVVRLQDRIIRLEMQLRLARLGLESSFPKLSMRQLVGLRFASDAELPGLVDRAIRENLTGTQIKKAITDWQADWLRT